MRKNRKIIYFCIVFIELVAISILMVNIYFTHPKVRGEGVGIFSISRDDLIFPNDSNSELKNFHEPKPNTKLTNNQSELPSDYEYTITINKDSLNERFDYSIDKDDEVYRIITLGDSHTYGWAVNTPENYPERLEELLNRKLACDEIDKFEVINLGVSGYDIEYAAHRLSVRGVKYNPDLILWYLKDDDFSQIRDAEIEITNRYKDKIDGEKDSDEIFKNSYSSYFFRDKIRKVIRKEIGDQTIIDYQIAALEKTNKYYDGNLVFLTISWLRSEYKSALSNFAKTRDDTYLFEIKDTYDHFPNDTHPTSKGYATISKWIFDYLTNNQVIPCK